MRAARATRISCDAVHDWINNDPTFARAFAQAKRQYKNMGFCELETALAFFSNIARPIIPRDSWPRVVTALTIAMTNLKNDLKGGRRLAVPLSGEVAEVSLSRERSKGVAIQDRDTENSAYDL